MSQPERAPDSQRDKDARVLYEAEDKARGALDGTTGVPWDLEHEEERGIYRAMADALLAAREKDGYEGIANDLMRELATARERVAALERLADELRILLVESEARGETHRWKGEQAEGREGALRKGLGAAILAYEAATRIPNDLTSVTWRALLAPTADRSAPETCWLIERAIDGVPHWLAWRGRDAISWTANAHEADRYSWGVAASREARLIAATQGITCQATEHQFLPDPRPRGR